VRAKSGSAESVVNYAGYLTKNNVQVLAFSFFVNNACQSRYSVRRGIEVFLERLLVN
jgi:D-alanyl-D-alanine carboxypeptidase